MVENVLEEMGVNASATARTLEMIVASAAELGLITETNGSKYVDLDAVAEPADLDTDNDNGYDEDEDDLSSEEEAQDPSPPVAEKQPKSRPTAIFVGGRKGKVRDQLEKLLAEYSIPYKVAEDEAHKGRPIPKR